MSLIVQSEIIAFFKKQLNWQQFERVMQYLQHSRITQHVVKNYVAINNQS